MVSAGRACLVEADEFRLEQIGYQTAAPMAFAALLIAAKPAPTASDWALTLPPRARPDSGGSPLATYYVVMAHACEAGQRTPYYAVIAESAAGTPQPADVSALVSFHRTESTAIRLNESSCCWWKDQSPRPPRDRLSQRS